MDSIRIKRGMSTELPKSLPLGELAFCIDTRELWVGSGDGLALKRVTNTEITQHLDEWNALYTEVDERFETKYIEVSTQFATKFDEICNQFSVKSDSLDRQFADKFEEICVQFSDKYAGLEAEYAKKLHNIDVLSSDNKESIDLLKRDIGTTENIEDLRQINNLATDTLNDLQAIREDLESDISEIGDFKEDVRKAHIDYSGTHHEKLKDSMDANVDFIMGEFNSVTHTGEYITAQDTILRHIKRAEMRGHTEVNLIQEPSGQDLVLPYEFEDTQSLTLQDTKESGAVNIVLKGNTEVNVLKNPMRDYVVPYEFEEGYTATLTDTKETGSIQSAILKGNTLVNCVDTTVFSRKTDIVSRSDDGIITIPSKNGSYIYAYGKKSSLFKPSTNYTLFLEIMEFSLSAGGLEILNPRSTIFTNAYTAVHATGYKKILLTTKDDISDCDITLRLQTHPDANDGGVAKVRYMILEGDYTNVDIPYFEGMQSVRMPVLSIIGKNIYSANEDDYLDNHTINAEGILTTTSLDRMAVAKFIAVKPNTTYYFSVNGSDSALMAIYGYVKEDENTCTGMIINPSIKGNKFTTGSNDNFIRIRYNLPKATMLAYQIQIEEGTQATSYEPFKSNILTVNEPIELRGIGDVQDTLDCLTGEVTKNVSELEILNDLSKFSQSGTSNSETLVVICSIGNTSIRRNRNFLSTHEISKYATLLEWYGGLSFKFMLPRTDSRFADLGAFKNYMQENPFTYVRELEEDEKSIKTVDLSILDQDGLSVPALSTYNEVTHIDTTVPENSLKPLISSKTPEFPVMIKPNTKYSIVADTTTNGFDEIPLTYNLGGAEVETSVGEKLTVIQTPSTLTNETFKVTGTGMKLSNVMILEKDLTGKEIPNYIEGMQSVQMSVLTTTGKNIFGGELINGYINSSGNWGGSSDNIGCKDFISITPNDKVAISLYDESLTRVKLSTYVRFYDINFNAIGSNIYFANSQDVIATAPTNAKYLKFYYSGTTKLNVQIEQNSIITTYEPYKSNILMVNEPVELRGIGDVQDTLNCLTGEMTERIGEIVLDGSENWVISQFTRPNHLRLYFTGSKFKKYQNVINSRFPDIGNIQNRDVEGVYITNTFDIQVEHSRLSEVSLDGFKQWLSQNPITVQYRLATESIKTVDFTITNQNGAKVTKLSTFNDVTYISTTVAEGALNPIISHKDLEYEVLLKPNTKYSIITNPISNKHPNSPISFDLGGQEVETTVGSYCTLVTTPNSLTHNKLVMKGRGNKLRGGVMVIEGDKTGMRFSHFDGMKSVDNLTVRVNNANLIDKKDYCRQEQLIFDSGYSYKKFAYIQLKPRTEYVLTLRDLVIPAGNWNVLNVDGDNSDIGYATVYNYNQGNTETDRHVGNVTRIFMTDSTGRVRFSNYTQGGTNVTGTNYGALFGNLCSSITLQESQNIGDNVPQESNSLPLTIPMRSLPNGVCDTLNLLTGEYVQNIEELILNGDGSHHWRQYPLKDEFPDVIGFYHTFVQKRINPSQGHYTGKLPIVDWSFSGNLSANGEGININQTDHLKLSIYKHKLSSLNVAGFEQWLSENPIRLQYQLREPIVTKLDLQWEDGKLFAYDGITHFFVDVDGGYLQPVLDIDVPTDIVAELSRLRAERTELETSKASLESQITLLDKHNKELVSQVKQLSETNTQLANETKSLRNQTRVNKNNLNYTKSYLLEGQKVLEFNQEELQQEQERTKTEQQVQDQQILSSMLASTEIFELVLALMPMQLGNERQSTEGGSKMVEVYVTLIIAGEKTLEQVPALVRPKVEAQLKAMGVLA